jgi:hypothetical protein
VLDDSLAVPLHDGGSQHNRRWGMIGFVFLATVVNYLNSQTLSCRTAAP